MVLFPIFLCVANSAEKRPRSFPLRNPAIRIRLRRPSKKKKFPTRHLIRARSSSASSSRFFIVAEGERARR